MARDTVLNEPIKNNSNIAAAIQSEAAALGQMWSSEIILWENL